MTRRADALAAVESGVHALGFIFYRNSPRYISPDDARDIIGNLPAGVTTVGVFVNHDVREVISIVETCRIDMIQLHGDESVGYARMLSGYRIIRALSPQRGETLPDIELYPASAVLIDGHDRYLYGGTGTEADWDIAGLIGKRYPLILSGGLHVGNIEDALRRIGPPAVDINSGCEEAPGKKDHKKIREIIEMVRHVDNGSCEEEDSQKIFRQAESRERT
jgi:phosphoribosylanthranilate isomerase